MNVEQWPLDAQHAAADVETDPEARARLEAWAAVQDAKGNRQAAADMRKLLADTMKAFSIHQSAVLNRQIEGVPGRPGG